MLVIGIQHRAATWDMPMGIKLEDPLATWSLGALCNFLSAQQGTKRVALSAENLLTRIQSLSKQCSAAPLSQDIQRESSEGTHRGSCGEMEA